MMGRHRMQIVLSRERALFMNLLADYVSDINQNVGLGVLQKLLQVPQGVYC